MSLKEKIYNHCLAIVSERAKVAEIAMNAAKESGNNETKSSVGDKYETGRAMAQIEAEKNKVQLIKANQLLSKLRMINLHSKKNVITEGCLIKTDKGIFFVAIGLGKIYLEGNTYYVISNEAPIYKAFHNKKINDQVQFQTKKIQILDIA